jgi:hypothetical protein
VRGLLHTPTVVTSFLMEDVGDGWWDCPSPLRCEILDGPAVHPTFMPSTKFWLVRTDPLIEWHGDESFVKRWGPDTRWRIRWNPPSTRLSWQQTCGSVRRLPIPPSSIVSPPVLHRHPLRPHPWRKSGLSGIFGGRSDSGGLCLTRPNPARSCTRTVQQWQIRGCTTSPIRAAGSVQGPSSR